MVKSVKKFLKYRRLTCYILLFKYKCNSLKSITQKKKDISKNFKKKLGYEMDWNNPTSFLQKLNYSKLFCANEIKTRLSDKVLVREWVENKIGKEYLIPLLGIYDCFKEINISELPDKFVIKCNHDSASVTICNDKSKLDLKSLERKYNYLLQRNFADVLYEMHYKDIQPKILIEKHMGSNINDYKFICFNSEPLYCWVDTDRFIDHKRCVFDMDWNIAPFTINKFKNGNKMMDKPIQFDEMKEIVKRLCKGFDYVRVDLYLIDEKVYFGEMTFTGGGGQESIRPLDWDYKLGELWKLNVNN